MNEKTLIVGPTDPARVVLIQGVPFAVIADLPEGGHVSWVVGANPIGEMKPGCSLAPGAMVLVLPAEIAAQLRPGLREAEKKEKEKLGLLPGNNNQK